ncbi:uncharacterized protein LOC142358961 [Opisthocomus hoazin]|uniref:uncharacterized protein LOC142358961 n=1 Tax=Opisthocomus hoazin TaxID=30419 RepID=UPI003F52A3F2
MCDHQRMCSPTRWGARMKNHQKCNLSVIYDSKCIYFCSTAKEFLFKHEVRGEGRSCLMRRKATCHLTTAPLFFLRKSELLALGPEESLESFHKQKPFFSTSRNDKTIPAFKMWYSLRDDFLTKQIRGDKDYSLHSSQPSLAQHLRSSSSSSSTKSLLFSFQILMLLPWESSLTGIPVLLTYRGICHFWKASFTCLGTSKDHISSAAVRNNQIKEG